MTTYQIKLYNVGWNKGFEQGLESKAIYIGKRLAEEDESEEFIIDMTGLPIEIVWDIGEYYDCEEEYGSMSFGQQLFHSGWLQGVEEGLHKSLENEMLCADKTWKLFYPQELQY